MLRKDAQQFNADALSSTSFYRPDFLRKPQVIEPMVLALPDSRLRIEALSCYCEVTRCTSGLPVEDPILGCKFVVRDDEGIIHAERREAVEYIGNEYRLNTLVQTNEFSTGIGLSSALVRKGPDVFRTLRDCGEFDPTKPFVHVIKDVAYDPQTNVPTNWSSRRALEMGYKQIEDKTWVKRIVFG